MTDFLGSLKSDLLDRRMLPLLVLVGVALIGALAYALLGGGGGSSPTPVVSPIAALSTPSSVSSISATAAPTATKQPVAETTSGLSHRSPGGSRNPFSPLPGSKAESASTKSEATPGTSTTTGASPESSSSTSGSSGASSPESSSGGGASSAPTPTPAPSKKKKSSTVYRVGVLFGAVPAGTPAPSPSLTPYENLTRQQPLPSTAQPLVVYRGIVAGAKSATFTLVGEAILRGNAVCHPSASQCQMIGLKLGETEELEYVPPGGAPVVYQLELVKISATKTTASAARAAFRGQSKTGLRLLRATGLAALPGMHYSRAKGVLVFARHSPAFSARAHAAARATSP